MTVPAKALELVDPAKLRIDHEDYAGMTHPEARRAIKVLLDAYNMAIAMERIDKVKINAVLGKDAQGEQKPMPEFMESMAQMEGITLVRVYYDNTEDTGEVKVGYPVCLDTVKGNAVTGVHEDWEPDEYKVVGVALENFTIEGEEGHRIAIRLLPPSAIAAEDAAIFVTKAKPSESYPVYVAGQGRRIFPAVKLLNPTFTGNGSGGVTGTEGTSPVDLMQMAFLARYVLAGTKVLAWKISEKWYFDYLPPAMIAATLTEDLLLGALPSSASVNVSTTTPSNILASNEKVKLFGGTRPGYKYPSGTLVIAALLGTEYAVIKSYTCPLPQ